MKSINKKSSKSLNNREISKKTINKRTNTLEDQEFENYLQKIEDPDYDGQDVSWHLSENATPVEKAKYELCEKILGYQQHNNLTDEEIANKIKITTGETKDILYCHIDYFTLDRLITYTSRLFSTSEVKITVEPKKVSKNIHARV
jgi:predicted XRE-type DNA-binding protein